MLFFYYVKEFLAILRQQAICMYDDVYFTTETRIHSVFSFIFKFVNPIEVGITKDLICTRKQNPEGFWQQQQNDVIVQMAYSGLFSKHFRSYRRFPKTNEEVQPLLNISEEPSQHLTAFSSETVNIKKLANLTANTKNYGQITPNIKPH